MASWLLFRGYCSKCFQLCTSENKENKSSFEAMQDNTWVRDIRSALGWRGLVQYLDLWDSLATIELNGTDDTNLWKFEASGTYSTRSAHRNSFAGSITFEPWKQLWKSWAPSKCKTFCGWQLGIVAGLQIDYKKRGFPYLERCPLCDQEDDCVQHILTSCVFARQFWFAILQPLNLSHLTPSNNIASFAEWWRRSWKKLQKHPRKGFNSLCIPGA